jgi:hypothetical protein
MDPWRALALFMLQHVHIVRIPGQSVHHTGRSDLRRLCDHSRVLSYTHSSYLNVLVCTFRIYSTGTFDVLDSIQLLGLLRHARYLGSLLLAIILYTWLLYP